MVQICLTKKFWNKYKGELYATKMNSQNVLDLMYNR